MNLLYSGLVGFFVGIIGGWFLASTRPALGKKRAEKLIKIGALEKENSNLYPAIYVTVGSTSTGISGFLLPLTISNVSGLVKFKCLSDGKTKAFKGLPWLFEGLDVSAIDIRLPKEYKLVIASDNNGVLCPGEDMPLMGGYPLTSSYDITVQVIGPTDKVITERHFPNAIINGKLASKS
jgi:hypothetical protein